MDASADRESGCLRRYPGSRRSPFACDGVGSLRSHRCHSSPVGQRCVDEGGSPPTAGLSFALRPLLRPRFRRVARGLQLDCLRCSSLRRGCYRGSPGAGSPSPEVAVCADTLTPEERSERMSRIRRRDTGPERALRGLLTDLGYRYRLQYGKVPGRPDIALPGRRKVIWMHGCFWHQHPGCPKATVPKSRREFWVPKLEGNRRRDLAAEAEARRQGWDTLVVWECELRDPGRLKKRLKNFLA